MTEVITAFPAFLYLAGPKTGGLMHTLMELLESLIKDLYSAECQLLKALPKLVKRAASQNLRDCFERNLQQTAQHIGRLEKAAQIVGFKPAGTWCRAMEGLLTEQKAVINARGNDAVVDAGLIGTAKCIEHYEISAYQMIIALASHLGFSNIAALLEISANEKRDAHVRLNEIFESEILAAAPLETRMPPEQPMDLRV